MIAGVAQDKTIMILESGLPYTDTYWFYSGHGNALDEAQIKDQWKKIGISFLLHIPEMVGFSLWARTLASPTSLIFYNQNGQVIGLWINGKKAIK